jgi:hypothetical protein
MYSILDTGACMEFSVLIITAVLAPRTFGQTYRPTSCGVGDPTPCGVCALSDPSRLLQQQQAGHIPSCATFDLLLKHPDATLATYV